jgi:hypothetical protein
VPEAASPAERPHTRESAQRTASCSQLELLGNRERIVNLNANVSRASLWRPSVGIGELHRALSVHISRLSSARGYRKSRATLPTGQLGYFDRRCHPRRWRPRAPEALTQGQEISEGPAPTQFLPTSRRWRDAPLPFSRDNRMRDRPRSARSHRQHAGGQRRAEARRRP